MAERGANFPDVDGRVVMLADSDTIFQCSSAEIVAKFEALGAPAALSPPHRVPSILAPPPRLTLRPQAQPRRAGRAQRREDAMAAR